jgi:hypothetical protein
MQRIFLLMIAFALVAGAIACGSLGSAVPDTGDNPTNAYKKLYAAVKSKNTEDIKANLSKKTQDFAQMAAQRQNSPIEKVFENGFTATTFAEKLPEIRDERIDGDFGAVEVWNSKESHWEDLGFVKEDGRWKLAIGEMFAGTFKSPGKGRDAREKEAANAVSNNMIPLNMNVNGNFTGKGNSMSNVEVIKPKERPENSAK